jgi:hypothetical protein
MDIEQPLPKLLEEISLTNLHRIDVALEGDWNSTVVTVWTRKDRFLVVERGRPLVFKFREA